MSGFDPARLLCIVGTNHATYEVKLASALNQLASWLHGQDLNQSDGLVKQTSAVLYGAHRAHVHKCHGGEDSLVTSREAFELATRFFHGGFLAQVRVESLSIADRHSGLGLLASLVTVDPEYYVGFSVKPRQLDFYLNRQDAASENCFGPFDRRELTADDFVWDPGAPAANGIVFEGFFNPALGHHDAQGRPTDLVFRFDTYLGERDARLLGHSDTVIVSQQSYFQVKWPDTPPDDGQPPFTLLFYPRVPVADGACGDPAAQAVSCRYEDGRFLLDLDWGVVDAAVKMRLAITITAGAAPAEQEG